jgi:hypothetical protein
MRHIKPSVMRKKELNTTLIAVVGERVLVDDLVKVDSDDFDDDQVDLTLEV